MDAGRGLRVHGVSIRPLDEGDEAQLKAARRRARSPRESIAKAHKLGFQLTVLCLSCSQTLQIPHSATRHHLAAGHPLTRVLAASPLAGDDDALSVAALG